MMHCKIKNDLMALLVPGVKKVLFISVLAVLIGCSTTSAYVSVPRIVHKKVRKPRIVTLGKTASQRCRALLPTIKSAATKMGIDPALLVGLVRVESNFNPQARSGVGAMGLTQVMAKTGAAKGCSHLYDPGQNLLCGARVLRDFLRYYHNNLVLALSGYNAGHYYPDKADRTSAVPKNFAYVENVLRARAHFLMYGCRW